MRVLIRGVEYESVAAAAKALRVRKGAVYKNISRGEPDTTGRKRGQKKGAPSPNRKPTTIGGFSWPSVTHAARDLGIKRRELSKILKREDQTVLIVALMKFEAKKIQEIARNKQMLGETYLQTNKRL